MYCYISISMSMSMSIVKNSIMAGHVSHLHKLVENSTCIYKKFISTEQQLMYHIYYVSKLSKDVEMSQRQIYIIIHQNNQNHDGYNDSGTDEPEPNYDEFLYKLHKNNVRCFHANAKCVFAHTSFNNLAYRIMRSIKTYINGNINGNIECINKLENILSDIQNILNKVNIKFASRYKQILY